MANVVRDPREHPDAILGDLANNPIQKVDVADVALVYGSIWKQRYFTKVGDDYFPLPVQWDVTHRTWKKYFVENGTDWWVDLYPPDNKQRPTGPLCDGCHSVGYDVTTKKVAEWNVGCERCHGPGSRHAENLTEVGMIDPAHLSPVDGSDTCIQCHSSQGRPAKNPIEGRYYDWPVGYQVGDKLHDYWELEEHRLGDTTFTHYADGTAHKNRMQGNDFVRSVMYTRGVTCFDCHDPHGTNNPAQLKKPANELCLSCHQAGGRNGPFAPTLEEHTHHRAGKRGQPVHRLSHAPDRDDDRRREGARSHLRRRDAVDDGQAQGAEQLQHVPRRQDDPVGDPCHAEMAGERSPLARPSLDEGPTRVVSCLDAQCLCPCPCPRWLCLLSSSRGPGRPVPIDPSTAPTPTSRRAPRAGARDGPRRLLQARRSARLRVGRRDQLRLLAQVRAGPFSRLRLLPRSTRRSHPRATSSPTRGRS